MLVIIGSGLAGYMLAKEWRKLDANTPLTIVTADDGAFYSKPLLSTALTQQKNPEQLIITNANTLSQELNAKIICYTEVKSIDAVNQTIFLNQELIKFSRLVLACGAEVIFPKINGNAAKEMLSVNSLTDYRLFRKKIAGKKKLAILGTGLVGCEFANDLVNAGFEVMSISPDPYPLASVLPQEVGLQLQQFLAAKGVQWRLNNLVSELNYQNEEFIFTLSDGQELKTAGVLSAIGLRPKTELAKKAGLIVNRGIVVNRFLQTNFSNIFALGDCAEVNGLVQMYVAPLLQCARALARTLAGSGEPVHYPAMPIVVKTPAFPLVFSPCPAGITGTWQITGEGHHLQALFYDVDSKLRGFVLAGDKVRDKISLAKQLPLVFKEELT